MVQRGRQDIAWLKKPKAPHKNPDMVDTFVNTVTLYDW